MPNRHLLVLVNATVGGTALVDAVRDIALSQDADVLVVAPELNTRLRHWMSDSDGAHHAAGVHLAGVLSRLRDAGVRASGHVGDADPIRAIDDAMRLVAADEIVIGTNPGESPNWLARDLVARTCARYDVPVVHVADDVEVDVAAAQRGRVAA